MPRVLMLAGLVVLAAAWLGPLPELARHSFTAHMTMHVSVIAVAVPMLALGIAGARFDPVRRYPAVFAPIPASIIELVIVWAWHAPLLHAMARESTTMLLAEQGSFFVAGMLVWLASFGGSPVQQHHRAIAATAGLLLTSMHMTLLGVLLALANRPLYAHTHDALFGLASLEDQHLGGVIMLLFGGAVYLLGALYRVAGLLKWRRNVVSLG